MSRFKSILSGQAMFLMLMLTGCQAAPAGHDFTRQLTAKAVGTASKMDSELYKVVGELRTQGFPVAPDIVKASVGARVPTDEQGRIRVSVRLFAPLTSATRSRMETLGAIIDLQSPDGMRLDCRLPASGIDSLAELAFVRYVSPASKPIY